MQSSPPSYKKKRHVTCKIQTVIRLSERSELLLSAVWPLIKECMSLASKSSSWSCTPSRGRTKEVAVIYCTVCFLIYRVNEYLARQCWRKLNHKKDDTFYCNCEQVYSENWVLLLWTYCPPTSYTTAPPCGNWNRPSCLSFGVISALNTYDLSMSLFLNSQKLVDSRPNSSSVPSNPENTKNDPLPCFIMSNLFWTSTMIKTVHSYSNVLTISLQYWINPKRSIAHLYWLWSQGEGVSGRWWRCHSLKQPQVHEPPLLPDLSSLSHLKGSLQSAQNILPSTDEKLARIVSYRTPLPSRWPWSGRRELWPGSFLHISGWCGWCGRQSRWLHLSGSKHLACSDESGGHWSEYWSPLEARLHIHRMKASF